MKHSFDHGIRCSIGDTTNKDCCRCLKAIFLKMKNIRYSNNCKNWTHLFRVCCFKSTIDWWWWCRQLNNKQKTYLCIKKKKKNTDIWWDHHWRACREKRHWRDHWHMWWKWHCYCLIVIVTKPRRKFSWKYAHSRREKTNKD